MSAGHVVFLKDVESALERIKSSIHRTPVMTCSALDALSGGGRRAFYKVEAFQKSGSFKARGAMNTVMTLSDEAAAKGVCTHSSGNHAAALAVAAKIRGIKAHIVMPSDCPKTKKAAVLAYGGEVVECEPTQKAREETAAKVAAETGARFVHPSEDPLVIAGQGTLALELVEQVAEMRRAEEGAGAVDEGQAPLDAVIVPIGGGGMTSGIAAALKGRYGTNIRIIAAEPKNAADAYLSKESGELQKHATPPKTVADGLKTTLGPNTFPIVRDLVDAIITVSEEDIISSMRLVWTRMKTAIEPSAGVGVAVFLSEDFKKYCAAQAAEDGGRPIKNVGVVLCGGNVDIDALPW